MKPIKNIIIIGSGIAGLRAGLELTQHPNVQITILEKSSSVGGRVATRRFGDLYVNHGAEKFDGIENVLHQDPIAEQFLEHDFFQEKATDLPKKLRDELLLNKFLPVDFKFNWEVSKVQMDSSTLLSATGEKLSFDQLIITAPVPQIEKMTGMSVPGVDYYKCILFLGPLDGKMQRIEMNSEWSEQMFEQSDEEILKKAAREKLNVKKWRYARVKNGLNLSFLPLSNTIILAGDAFDPEGKFNLASSWLSGLNAGREILGRLYE